ncbi:hypothetical protein EDD41_0582 [Luteococcus japonicus]|uniref:Uncharacterized protein n=1 Tax=Luteococcus japonicus TaxID=33984 RepID=A0A3N1ZRE5_9ACTN|nr:hypothetical protein [Luteococcus japonicus]ROR53433.1 hypothetical protein EDD41_0582 [Luteococcus japonicus]
MSARKRSVVGLLALLSLLAVAVGGRYIVIQWRQSAPIGELESNWGVRMPRSLTPIEQRSEPRFHGDGYRIKVFAPTLHTTTEGTFLDVTAMSTKPLTAEERGLVTQANAQLRPAHPLDPDTRSLRKAHALMPNGWTDNEFVLGVYDPATDLFYVYESFM